MCTHIYMCCMRVYEHIAPNFFWCILDTFLIIVASFIKI